MVASRRAWWRRWGRGESGDLSFARELRDIASGLTPRVPGEALSRWLASVGWTGDRLSPQDAHALLARWN
eukprot:7560383-Alexandrium_andersonii.AAC.1